MYVVKRHVSRTTYGPSDLPTPPLLVITSYFKFTGTFDPHHHCAASSTAVVVHAFVLHTSRSDRLPTSFAKNKRRHSNNSLGRHTFPVTSTTPHYSYNSSGIAVFEIHHSYGAKQTTTIDYSICTRTQHLAMPLLYTKNWGGKHVGGGVNVSRHGVRRNPFRISLGRFSCFR
ncbi:hypothetical protein HRR83_003420 [Exophiala dermatitidis]|uniref:Uncharacterized protein n=1 Tax=Exophiala dermatitidis TaxID=5970 RepID=A0AAN6EY21_EXODE|nr:hypothetical protein HRR74_004420 [Exophiala dermatitidis]KAJ4521023.1 hypothetical protein HRR73_003364 [Exophiala dermatitidis]KAJ4547606.1 hypothetical protein HRR76_000238 [Exophiala dermatitidis]KAJ4553545.1 hypothetical protein HRR77_009610 [Exophiala dermatitidis]KAJ4563416.1 hypothetical protein HRR79_009816 [Exophiala dermatitidis]